MKDFEGLVLAWLKDEARHGMELSPVSEVIPRCHAKDWDCGVKGKTKIGVLDAFECLGEESFEEGFGCFQGQKFQRVF